MWREMLVQELSHAWGLVWFRQIVALGFAGLLSAYPLVSGASQSRSALRLRRWLSHGWVVLMQGLLLLSWGVVALLWPRLTPAVPGALVALWSSVFGSLTAWSACRRRCGSGEWLLPLVWSGVSIGFGVLAVRWPGTTHLFLLWVLTASVLWAVLVTSSAPVARAASPTVPRHAGVVPAGPLGTAAWSAR